MLQKVVKLAQSPNNGSPVDNKPTLLVRQFAMPLVKDWVQKLQDYTRDQSVKPMNAQ